MDFSSGESDVDSEEEVEKAKRAAKAEKNKKETKTLADLPDTEDLVVPAIEDLDSMSLEQITELREKIRQKVEKAQEEEKITEAKKMEQDDDYEYVWAEADPEEESRGVSSRTDHQYRDAEGREGDDVPVSTELVVPRARNGRAQW